MTGKCISIHSSRGGTGKTLLATNLAILYAKKGFNVALLDLDFRAPSLSSIFKNVKKPSGECNLNIYLDGRCSPEAVTVDVAKEYSLPGKFLVGFANPEVYAIRAMMEKSKSWEVSAVKRLFSLRSKLFNEMDINYCIYDTSPGVQYTSINAAVSADLSVIVSTLDSLDLLGTQNILFDLYDEFEKKSVIMLNKVLPESCIWSEEEKAKVISEIGERFRRPVVGAIPCYCDVLKADRSKIMAIENPLHHFIQDLEGVRQNIDRNL